MNDIAELERRIASALDRIARGVEGLGAAGDGEVPAAPEAAARFRSASAPGVADARRPELGSGGRSGAAARAAGRSGARNTPEMGRRFGGHGGVDQATGLFAPLDRRVR